MANGKRSPSLRIKIAVGLLLSLIAILVLTSWLRYVSFRRLLIESVAPFAVDAQELVAGQLSTYLRSRVVLSVGTVVAMLLLSDLIVRAMVTDRLRRFLRVVKRVHPGGLDAKITFGGRDEIVALAEAFTSMTEDLRRQAQQLSILNDLHPQSLSR